MLKRIIKYAIILGSIFQTTLSAISWKVDSKPIDQVGDYSYRPQIAIEGNGKLHAVWQRNESGTNKIYHASSTNGGVKWIKDAKPIDQSGINCYNPQIAIYGKTLHSVYQREGSFYVYHAQSYIPSPPPPPPPPSGQVWGSVDIQRASLTQMMATHIIEWTEVVGASFYKIYKGNEYIGQTSSTHFYSKGKKKGESVTYTVQCVKRDGTTVEVGTTTIS